LEVKSLTLTDIVAFWGAIVSTSVLMWDIAKWQLAGPKLRLRVNAGMKAHNVPVYQDKLLIVAHVENYGDRSTTLTHMTFVPYANRWKLLRRRAETHFWVGMPNTQFPIPHELQPGKMWDGIVSQEEVLKQQGNARYLVCEIYHTHRNRPVRKRVVFR
jgi:hypothetical protein